MNIGYLISLIRSALGVLTSRIFGLLRDIAIAAVYGVSGYTDIFFVAFAIPNLFRQFFAEGAIASAYVPFLSDKLKHEGEEKAYIYITQLIITQSFLILILTALLMFFAKYVILAFMPGYSYNEELIILGSKLLRITMPFLLFVSICGLMAGYLNIVGSYFIVYASTAMLNIAMIAGSYLSYKTDGSIVYLAYGVIMGGLLQYLVIWAYAAHKKFRFRFTLKLDKDIKKTYALVIPSIAGVGVSQLNFLVGRVIASFIGVGSISWLFYANRLFQFPLGLFSITLSMLSLTELSKARTDNDLEKVKLIIDKAVLILLLIITPATVGLIGLSQELVELIYSRYAFDNEDTIKTAQALFMYSTGLFFYSMSAVLTRVYHSKKDTLTPVKYAVIAFIVNLGANLALMKSMGHVGIALSSSLASFVNALLLYKGLKEYKFHLMQYMVIIIKIAIATLGTIFIIFLGKIYNIHVLLTVTIAVVTYFLTLILLKVKLLRIIR